MTNHQEFKKGSKIVEDGKVYIVYDVEIQKSGKSNERILHYRPYFAKPSNSTVYCSIPAKHLLTSNLRSPGSRAELDNVIDYLSDYEKVDVYDPIESAKNLRMNSLYETAYVLKQCLSNQKSSGNKFDMTKKGTLSEAIDLMLEEVALVFEITLEEAFEKIKKASKIYYSSLAV